MIYLDIVLLVNAGMDAFILLYTAYLLRRKVKVLNILLAVALGELPVLLIIFDSSVLVSLSKVLIPPAMVKIGLSTKGIHGLLKGLLYFSLLTAVCGGIFYAFAGWIGLEVGQGEFISMAQLWIFPLIILLAIGGQQLWERIRKANLILDNILYDVELSYDGEKSLKIKALLDTGNNLRDPLIGTPVMIMEEKIAAQILPEKIKVFLDTPWQDNPNPWSFIWNDEEYALQSLVFISAKGISGHTWLPGVRMSKVKISQGEKQWEQGVTVALVPQVLNTENKYQALLHPEHVQKLIEKEEIA
jgi:stage II sporulation protein GA (sporulation sigma-E factor processing peptidase)